MDLPFHHNATPRVFENARFLKQVQTKAEEALWKRLRNRKLEGRKFRRQHPIEHYIVDFYCHESKLVIEVDGKIHELNDNPDYDKNRTQDLISFGLKVIRFTNEQVLNNIEVVLKEIKSNLTPDPSPSGEGNASLLLRGEGPGMR